MTDLHTAAKQALEALHGFIPYLPLDDEAQCGRYDTAITALRQALANAALDKKAENARELGLDYEPAQQEPVACVHIKDGCLVGSHRDQSKPFPDGQYGLWPIDDRPQTREPLTDEQVEKIIKDNMVLQMNLAGIRQDFEHAYGIKENT